MIRKHGRKDWNQRDNKHTFGTVEDEGMTLCFIRDNESVVPPSPGSITDHCEVPMCFKDVEKREETRRLLMDHIWKRFGSGEL